ncbi:HEAT repeat domain-containing protein [Streptomyces chartreusis]|uniref:HEAT repeat domain-containing protein n=1 Tax=Streptomyces chartreusis TaxID=1969 RepID=UPI00378D2DC5
MREDDGRDGGAVERPGASGGPLRDGLVVAESALERGAPGTTMEDVDDVAESVGAQRASGGPLREVRAVTESTVERLASGVPLRDVLDVGEPGSWTDLDVEVRASARYRPDLLPGLAWVEGRSGPTVSSLIAAAVGRLRRERGAEFAVESVGPSLALALCHPDGRVRAAALTRAREYPDLLPLIVVRAADWAEPVREPARELLRDALDVDAAVALAPLILLVGRRDRGDFGVRLLGEVLRRAPGERIGPLYGSADRTVRRFAHRLAVAEGFLSPAELAFAAARDGDAVIQDLCAEAALKTVSGDVGDDVLRPLLTARNPRARSCGVTALRRAGRAAEAERFLTDRSAVVRACARYVVRQLGTDPLPLYRAWCSELGPEADGNRETGQAREPKPETGQAREPKPETGRALEPKPETGQAREPKPETGQALEPEAGQGPKPGSRVPAPGAVIGLAECGERADAVLLWPLLAHPVPAVRARAVAGLRLLDVVDAGRLRPLLADPAPGVVRETGLALLPSAQELPSDWLMERLGERWPRYVRVAAFRLLSAGAGIVPLRAAVELLEDPDPKLRGWAEQAVQRWHPPAGLPSGEAEVEALLDRCTHLFSSYVLRRRKWEAGVGR